ncbi:MAG TPA: hypothetical protein VGT44_00620 [Ktedonobacteraceae bacterium]|nr:hypothetical protein [Ktedonobacteraceae bacterium]
MNSHQNDEFQRLLAKRAIAVAAVLCALAASAAARTITPRIDALGAHVNAGRGCPECHTPRRTSSPERIPLTRKAYHGGEMLWGQDVASTYAAYGSPSDHSAQNDGSDSDEILRCLTCHDGNYGPQAMMRNVVYETLPSKYGSLGAIPTLMDQESLIKGHQIEDHPLGLDAQIKCGGALGWDCTETNGVITMNGAHSSHFAASYGFFVKPSHHGSTSVVA